MRMLARGVASGFMAMALLSTGCDSGGTDGATSSAVSFKPPAPPPPSEGQLYLNFGDLGVALSDSSLGSGANDVLSIGSSIYVAGSFRTLPDTGRWKVEKRDAATGAVDKRFGGGVAPLGSVVRLAADQESLYVAGGELLGFHPDGQPDVAWRVEKRKLRSGVLDRTFGLDGVLTLNFSPFNDWCRSLIVDGADLYLIGDDSSHQDPQGATALQWRIEKRSALTGAPDVNFGNGGAITIYEEPLPGDSFNAQPYDAVLLDGSLVIVGRENRQWRIEKRDRVNGALVFGFGVGGVVNRDPGGNPDEARRVVSDGVFLYVAGNQYGPDGQAWRIEKFLADTGATETTFGANGVVTPLETSANTGPSAMVEVAGSLYVGGIHSPVEDPANPHWTLIKLQTIDGSPASTFGSGGILDIDPSAGPDFLNGLATDGQALYIVGTQNDNQWRIEKRAR